MPPTPIPQREKSAHPTIVFGCGFLLVATGVAVVLVGLGLAFRLAA